MCVVLSHSVISDSLWPQTRILECVPIPSSRDLRNPGIEPMSLKLQEDSSLSEPPGKAKNTGVGSLSLLQQIFPTQESNRGLLHCRQILYQLSHKGRPRILEWVAYAFSSRTSRYRNQTEISCIVGGFFTNWAIREARKIALVLHKSWRQGRSTAQMDVGTRQEVHLHVIR